MNYGVWRTDPDTVLLPVWYLLVRRRLHQWTPADITHYQQQQIQRIVRYARKYAPWYHDLYRDIDTTVLTELPITDKQRLMDKLTRANTLGLTRKEIFDFCLEVEQTRDFSRRYQGLNIGMSSGTSGNRGVEITTPREERYLRTAFLARFPFIPGEKLNLAFILRVSTPAFSLNRFGHRLTYVDQLQPMDAIVSQVQQIQPNVISGPASLLLQLARQRREGRLTTTPKRLISYAEVLTPEDRKVLRDTFGAEVHEIYKATEGAIGMSCAQGSLHINEDLVAVETLDGDGSPTPAGQPCRQMLVTDLHKTSVPIIRYALNDIITISPDRCACGSAFRVISQIQGRGDDLLWARTRNRTWHPIFPDFIRRAIISASDRIESYQVIQESPDEMTIRLMPALDQTVADAVTQRIRDVFEKLDCVPPAVTIEWQPPEPNKNSGKLIRIHRAFADPTQ